jgi:hypothetical protein
MERGAAEKHLRPAHQGVAGRCRRGGSPGRRCSYAGAATGPRQPWVWRFSCRVGLVDGGWDPSLCPDWALQRRDWPVAAEQKPLSWGGSMLQIPSFLVTRPRAPPLPCATFHRLKARLFLTSPPSKLGADRPPSTVRLARLARLSTASVLLSRHSPPPRDATPWSLVAHKFSAHHGQMGRQRQPRRCALLRGQVLPPRGLWSRWSPRPPTARRSIDNGGSPGSVRTATS